MAKHIHVHIHRAPTRDRAPVARAVRSIGRDQHAPEDVSQLVAVLMEAIASRRGQGKTADADFKEEDHKRDAGGKFTAGGMNADQHKAAAKEHRDILNAGTNSEKSVPHHARAAMHHESAAFALEDGATSQAEAHANHAAHHKANAAKIDEAHAITAHESRSGSASASSKPTSTTAKHKAEAAQISEGYGLGPGAKPMSDMDIQAALEKANPKATVPSVHPEHQGEGKGLDHPGLTNANLKPTSTTAKHIKPALHELFSSGHPFSVDELCKITGVTNPKLMSAYVTDMKNPKYAGKLGTLEIVKRPDGMYHVQKKEGAGLAPKPGPDGQLMGKHPELAAAERRVAENPRTTSGGAAPAPTPATKKPHAAGVSAGFSVSRELANLRSQGVDVSGVEQLTGARQRQAINSLLEARAASPDPLMHAAVAENPRTTSSPGLRNPGASFGGAMEAARLSGGTGSMESKSTSGK